VAEYKNGRISQYSIKPEDYFAQRQSLDGLSVEQAEQSLTLILAALRGEQDKAADLIAINAGAALYVAGVASSISEGVNLAQQAIQSGSALSKIQDLVHLTGHFTSEGQGAG
jgi:anthranilate phosphoribosyltransferase